MVTSRWTLQVADFGLHELRFASETSSGCENTSNYKLLWKAPELLRNLKEGRQGRGSQRGDVYSFGIILFEIYGRQGPYGEDLLEQMSVGEVLTQVMEGAGEMRPDIAVLHDVSQVILVIFLLTHLLKPICHDDLHRNGLVV